MGGQPLSPVAALFDAVAPVYETVGPPFFDHFGALLVEYAGVRRGDRVLDLAAGSGAVAVPALATAGPSGSLLAVDVAPGMVERLADRLSSTGHPAARAELGDAAGLEVDAGSFDVALCGFALFFLPMPVSALRAWRRAVRGRRHAGRRLAGRGGRAAAANRPEKGSSSQHAEDVVCGPAGCVVPRSAEFSCLASNRRVGWGVAVLATGPVDSGEHLRCTVSRSKGCAATGDLSTPRRRAAKTRARRGQVGSSRLSKG